MHYIIIIVVIAIILFFQFRSFFHARKKMNLLYEVFEEEKTKRKSYLQDTINDSKRKLDDLYNIGYSRTLSSEEVIQRKKLQEEISRLEYQLTELTKNDSTEKTIKDSIDAYLEKNKDTATDFSIIKDIVDRNCDALEEEIESQLPFPLYLGLMGTMAGIIIGVGFLIISGDLQTMLTNVNSAETGGNGIQALLGGVALAMFCSIVGILLTTLNTNKLKKVKARHEQRKHNYLTKLQTELLPTMNNSAATAMRRMTDNLNSFNKTFKTNVSELKSSLEMVNDSSRNQFQLMQEINNLKPTQLARANVQVYEKLKACSDEIGHLAILLENSTSYLESVHKLNEQLDKQQELTRLIQEMTKFFKETKEGMSGFINKSIGKAEEALLVSTTSFTDKLEKSYAELSVSVDKHQERLKTSLETEQKILSSKMTEISSWMEATKKQSKDTQELLKTVGEQTKKQTEKLDTTLQYLQSVTEQLAKKDGVTIAPQKSKFKIIAFSVVGLLISITCILAIIFSLPDVVEIIKSLR